MKIALVTPARPSARAGNWNTARRWAQLLRELGHRVNIELSWSGQAADVMVALHARRSHDSIQRFAQQHPERPLIVVLTGTDLYRDIRHDASAQESLKLATRLVVLQDEGLVELPRRLVAKARVVYQSAPAVCRAEPLQRCFEICVSGHLREEKDPFRLAAALSHLPADSRIRGIHMGAAMSPEYAGAARQWMRRERRYRWLGELPRWQALRRLARSRVMVISSHMEGGANVVTEAIAAGVPVIASRISGNIGMLGRSYAGYFATGDERALANLLWRAESEPAFYRLLRRQCAARRKLISRAREKATLKKLLADVAAAASRRSGEHRAYRRK